MPNIIYSSIMLVNAVLASYQVVAVWFMKYRTKRLKQLTCLVSLGSAIWSLGFGVMFLVSDLTFAARCRAFGLIGVFVFLSCITQLVGRFTSFSVNTRRVMYCIAALGYLLIPFVTQKSQMVFTLKDDRWISYSIVSSPVNTLYSVYCVVLCVILTAMIINIMRSPVRRNHFLGLQLLGVAAVMILGMILDTILPMFGFEAFPGSSITQFWGLALVLIAFRGIDRSQITLSNMSQYVYRNVSIPVIIYDVDYKPAIVNEASYAFLGRSRETTPMSEFDTCTLFGLYGNELVEEGKNRVTYDTACLINGAICKIILDTIRDRFGDIIGYVLSINDITEQMEAMGRLEDAKAIAEESNRSKSVFLANVSHELRTPMNSIIGFSELLMGSDLKPEDKDYVSDILTSSKSLLEIINDVLDISKVEAGATELVMSDFAPADLLKQPLVQAETLIAPKDLILRREFAEDMPSVMNGDDKRIREVITNLLVNAIKYTSRGTITLRVSTKDTRPESTILHMEFEDTGSGIKEEDIDTIFDTFTQVDKKIHQNVEGSGLGLAITRSYVELMEGTIRVESTYGKGSCFFVDIPLKVVNSAPAGKIMAEAPKPAAKSAVKPQFPGLRVLVVDDSKINLKVMANMLKSYGISATCVPGGPESIESCRQNEYDLIFMDQMMPDMNGEEAMAHIRELGGCYSAGERCKIIAFTANAVKGVSDELLEKGFDNYMSKPMDISLLEKILSDAATQE